MEFSAIGEDSPNSIGRSEDSQPCLATRGEKSKRRPHRKSRFGCKNCRARRIKCDEDKPECANCQHRQIQCDFATAPERSGSHTQAAEPVTRPSVSPDCLGQTEVELMYYWTTTTAKTLTTQEGGAVFWLTNVTEMSFTNRHLLHLIFAITALHLAHCRQARHDEYIGIADQHYAKALPFVTSELNNLTQENCDAALLCVQLIAFLGWAHGPQPGQFLAFGTDQRSDWLLMFRGIRTTMERLDYDKFTKSHSVQMSARGKPLQHATRPAFEQPLADLSSYVRYASALEDIAANTLAFEQLQECYHNRYNGTDTEYSMVFAWLFKLEDDVLEAMQRHDAVPLVLLAYFAVLIKDMETLWYMRGWTTHVLSGIWDILKDEDKVQLRWPIGIVGWIPP